MSICQPELDFDGRQYGDAVEAVRKLRVGNQSARMLLLILSIRTGRRGWWEMTTDELIEDTQASRSTYFESIKRLQAMGVVSVTDAGRSGNRFTLDHRRIAELVALQTAAAAADDFADGTANTIEQHADNRSQSEYRTAESEYRTRPITTHTTHTTTTTQPQAYGLAAMVAEVVRLGVADAVPAIDRATGRGTTPAEVMAICRHFEQHAAANGWAPGSLHRRLSHAYAGQPVAEGWPQPSKAARSKAAAADASRRDAERRAVAQADADQRAAATRDRVARFAAVLAAAGQTAAEDYRRSLPPPARRGIPNDPAKWPDHAKAAFVYAVAEAPNPKD